MNTRGLLVRTLLVLAAYAGSAVNAAEIFNFTHVDKPVPDGNLSGMSDSRTIASSVLKVTSLRVSLHIDGEFNGDLYAYLRHINGGRTNLCILLNRPGRTTSNASGYADTGLDVVFDDGAVNGDSHFYQAIVSPPSGALLTGTWQPDGRKVNPASVSELSPRTTTLGSFAGADANGEWTLYLVDAESGGTNVLRSWGLEISGAIAAPVSWTAPADLVYGAPLGPTQLNASSPIAGTFVYSPPLGTVLHAGSGQTLSVTFTPQDTTNYAAVTTSLSVNVSKRALTIAANNDNKLYGAPLPTFTAGYSGFVNGDGPDSLDAPVTLATTATVTSNAGAYPITASGAADADYAITFAPGTLTIAPAATTGVLTTSANPVLPGAPVTFSYALSAVSPGAGTPTGTAQFKVDGANAGAAVPLTGGTAAYATATLPAGSHTVSAEYAGSLNFLGTTNALNPNQLINTPPIAGAVTIQRQPGQGTKVAIAVLLANDTDADGDTISFVSFGTNSVNGGTVAESNGWLFYQPPPGFTNTDSFAYTITDGRGAPVTGNVIVAINVDMVPSPNVIIQNLGNGTCRIRFDGIPGATYGVQYTENLQVPDWQLLGSATADDSGEVQIIDTPPVQSQTRYYRSVFP